MTIEKVKLIEKKFEEGKLTPNEARILLDLEPIKEEKYDRLFEKVHNESQLQIYRRDYREVGEWLRNTQRNSISQQLGRSAESHTSLQH
ncbi:hypothetical protein CN498_19820 [Bacillus thuringiensis]|uniref:hypothetical protein n=1 Tax=Bacillus thuringiensis TaxID=1428 RepID=UPI000BF86734|nr:hypothetical protein [Bacillus thuringiensis]PER85859.1 hypothetical protein CN498_19820 [Bacillus thuringiensis]HDR4862297.1 hypothetical protein [Bacillus cereus]